MKRILLAVSIVAIGGALAVAQTDGRMHDEGPFARFGTGPYLDEARAIFDEWGDEVPAQLTFNQIEELAGELSIPAQKTAYERKSALASMFMPGAGQFMNDDPLSGALFVAGDLAITAGTLVGTYFLLPEQVRFGNLDYLGSSKETVKETWETAFAEMTLGRSLAIAGVLTGGMVADHVFARFSSKHAERLARERIAAGEVEFSARPELILGAGLIGFGMSMHY